MSAHSLNVPYKLGIIAFTLGISQPSWAQTPTELDSRLDQLEQRLVELEAKLAKKDQQIDALEKKNNQTKQLQNELTRAVFPEFAGRVSHKFNAPDKSIVLSNSDTTLQISGQIWLDAIYNQGEMTNRAGFQPSSISYDKGAVQDDTLLSVGQSNLSVRSYTPTQYGAMKTRFEFDMFDSQGEAGFHLTHLWGELGNWGAGQTVSGFTDTDAFPNIIDFWGPNSMAFSRQPQLRYTMDASQTDQFIFTL